MIFLQDFTLRTYQILLAYLIDAGYNFVTVRCYLTEEENFSQRPVVILRHDIDRRLQKSLIFADVDAGMGLSSTFYYRFPAISHKSVIQYVANRGHEVGYHYEVMSRASGDPYQARLLFVTDLTRLRKIVVIDTVCMHGAPLSGINNLSFWDHFQFSEFDLLGEAFLSLSGVQYFSDTGRTWSPEHKMRDRLSGDIKGTPSLSIQCTGDLMRYVGQFRPNKLYLVIHPERWAEGTGEGIILYGVDMGVNLGKRIISQIRELLP